MLHINDFADNVDDISNASIFLLVVIELIAKLETSFLNWLNI